MNNLGLVYAYRGNINTALNCLYQALEIYTKVYGKNHPDVTTCLNNIRAIKMHNK
ncbi:MAG: tetratricopeptide repeat protein [Candidatus Cryptobacteroides sp.]